MGGVTSFLLQSLKRFIHPFVVTRTVNYLWLNECLKLQRQYLMVAIDCAYLSCSRAELYLWSKLNEMLCQLGELVLSVISPNGMGVDSDCWKKVKRE